MGRLPNVLLIMADEFQAAALSCRGHPLVQTPNLDRLVARGVFFENAYTPSPICVPARASLATGRYVHSDRYWDNAMAYDGRVGSWMQDLKAAGFPATSIGKLHFRSATDPTGFANEILSLHIADGIGQVWGSVRDPLPKQPHTARMLDQIGAGLSKYNEFDIAVAERAVQWIQEAGREKAWVLSCSFVAPHFPLIAPQAFVDLYPPERMPMPELRNEHGYISHPWLARMTQYQDNDGEFDTHNDRRRAISSYYALCSFVDHQIGLVLNALDSTGQADNTLVIFCSDHGETLGMRNRWGKGVMYGEATRIPLVLAGAGLAPGRVVSTPVSLIDLAPTVCDALQVERKTAGDGESLLQLISKPDVPERVVFSEYHAVASPSGAFMVADARFKYHYYVGYMPELFDLDVDPQEKHNLAGLPETMEVEAKMRASLFALCDPEQVDRQAKADQLALVNRFGGRQAALQLGPKGASPVP